MTTQCPICKELIIAVPNYNGLNPQAAASIDPTAAAFAAACQQWQAHLQRHHPIMHAQITHMIQVLSVALYSRAFTLIHSDHQAKQAELMTFASSLLQPGCFPMAGPLGEPLKAQIVSTAPAAPGPDEPILTKEPPSGIA